MKKMQFVSLFSDRDDKKVIKVMHDTYFYARKFLKLKPDHSKYACELIQSRIDSKFCGLKEPFESSVSINPENVVVATCPFNDYQSLLEFIEGNPARVKSVSELLETFMLLMLRSDNEYFYSYENIFVNPFTFEMSFAPFSIAGLIPLRFKTSFSKTEFSEVYELLDDSMFTGKEGKVTYKAKFRALGMIILHTVLQRRISLLLDNDIPSEEVSFEEARRLVGLLQDRFLTLLTIPYAKQLIIKAGERDRIDYYYFLKVVFIDKCLDLTWEQARRCLIGIHKSEPSDIDQPLENVARNLYLAQKQYSKEKLSELGIFDSQLNIYLVFKLQLSKLDFDRMSDLITREKYVSADNFQLFNGIVKQLQKLKESRKKSDENGKQKVLYTFDLADSNSQIQAQGVQHKKDDSSKGKFSLQKQQLNNFFDKMMAIPKPESKLPPPSRYLPKTESQAQPFIEEKLELSQCSKKSIEDDITQRFMIDTMEADLFTNQHPGGQEIEIEVNKVNEEILIKEMVNHFKTNVSEFRGTKIHALDYKMAIINRFLKL